MIEVAVTVDLAVQGAADTDDAFDPMNWNVLHRPLSWLAASAAVALDAQAPQAQFYLARCTDAGVWPEAAQWLAVGSHLQSFPLTCAAMAMMCVQGSPSDRPRWLQTIPSRITLMLVTMPVICSLALSLSFAFVPSAWQALSYPAVMLMLSSATDGAMRACFAVSRRRLARMALAGQPSRRSDYPAGS